MFRQHKLLLVVALSGVAIAVATLRPAANAQSGQALVFAERACLDYGVAPNTAPFESCVERASRAFDRGEPDLAYMQARWTREARDACQSYGVAPDTAGYGRCIARQVDQRMSRKAPIRFVPPSSFE